MLWVEYLLIFYCILMIYKSITSKNKNKKSLGKTKPTNALICVISPSFNQPGLYIAGSGLVLLFPETPERRKPKVSLVAGEMRCGQLVETMGNPLC